MYYIITKTEEYFYLYKVFCDLFSLTDVKLITKSKALHNVLSHQSGFNLTLDEVTFHPFEPLNLQSIRSLIEGEVLACSQFVD